MDAYQDQHSLSSQYQLVKVNVINQLASKSISMGCIRGHSVVYHHWLTLLICSMPVLTGITLTVEHRELMDFLELSLLKRDMKTI